jgi:hypothetical protein
LSLGGERLAGNELGCCGLSHPCRFTNASIATGAYGGMQPLDTGQSLYRPIFSPMTIARLRSLASLMPIAAACGYAHLLRREGAPRGVHDRARLGIHTLHPSMSFYS